MQQMFSWKKTLAILVSTLLFGYAGLLFFTEPRTDRDWSPDQAVLAEIIFEDPDTVLIKNIRNATYRTTDDYDVAYYDKRFNLNDVRRAWFLVEPFGKFGAAHTLVSFEFADGSFLAVSAEIRKEKGESFSPFLGLLRQYELVYVIADEADVIKLRTNYRNDDVYLYPVEADPQKIRLVLEDMLKRAMKLKEEPEFYHTITNNCTTNIISHVRKFSNKPIPWYDFRYLFPATIDSLAYELGIIPTDASLTEIRKRYYITQKAQQCPPKENFSYCIRKPAP